jgi:hypothetical protein
MKNLLIVLALLFTTNLIAQSDTSDVYVINNTNRLVKVGGESYALIYRDLKSLKQIRSFHFDDSKELDRFFELCQKALEKDQGTVTANYNVSRNKLSKNVVRVNDKQGGYMLLKYSTLQHMKTALNGGE